MHVVPLSIRDRCGNIHDMNLARIRKLRGLNQAQLGEMVGVDQSTIQRAEAMHKSAKLVTYKQCADALGVSLADLFADDRTAEDRILLAAFDALPPARRQAWLAMAELAQQEAALEAGQSKPAEGR